MAAKKTFSSRKKKKILWIFLGFFLLFVLLLTFFPSSLEAFFNGFKDLRPKSNTVLPIDIQKAIVTEAVKELTQGVDYQHTDIVAQVDPQDAQIAQSQILADNPLYFFKKSGRAVQEFLTFDPLAKTQLILKHNSWEAIETLSLLQKTSKQNNQIIKGLAVNSAANEIAQVEDKFNQILSLSDKVSQTDKDKARAINEVAFNYAEKYFRDELILQGLEEKFDDSEVIKIENARAKGLGAFAKILTNYHPDPQILAREVANSLASETGTNYKELKTTELLQELEDASPDESQKLPLRLSQYILVERFEKKVLAMPTVKRQVVLDTLVNELPGNPMREFKTFSRIRRVFKSRELIIYADLYKAKILEHFESRVLGLSSSDLQSQFITNWVRDPADLRILEALELRAGAQKDTDPKLAGLIKSLKTLGYEQIAKSYGTDPEKLKDTLFYESATLYPDVLDIKVAVDLDKALGNSGFVKNLENQVVDKFVANLPLNLSGVAVNASEQTSSLLLEIKADIPLARQNEVLAAITAEITLDSIQVPETASAINNLVNSLEQSQDIAIVTQSVQAPIEEIISQADTQVSAPTAQEVLQRTEELTEDIFSAPAGQETLTEQALPPIIQQEIQQVQQTTNSTPQVNPTLVETVVNTVEQTQTNTPAAAPEVTVPAPVTQTPVTTTTTSASAPEAPPAVEPTVPAL
ncbi:hypothetical protein HY025_03160 [Candidatus Daviesbacteria bacterium]|nr:hypothetical protein [Candidatus Daviesbacteria bacterium]